MGNVFIDIYQEVSFQEIVTQLRNRRLNDLTDELPRYAAMIAKELHNKRLTSTQLRRFYTYVKAIEQQNKDLADDNKNIKGKSKLSFLLPKLAGSVKQTDKDKVLPLYIVFDSCLNGKELENVGELRLFVEFFEAILDYFATYK